MPLHIAQKCILNALEEKYEQKEQSEPNLFLFYNVPTELDGQQFEEEVSYVKDAMEVEMIQISKKLNTINTAFLDNADISNLMPKIRKFKKTVFMWHKITKKYGNNK